MNKLVVCAIGLLLLCCKPSSRIAAPIVPPNGFSLKEIFTGNMNPIDDKHPLYGVVSFGMRPVRTDYLFDNRDSYFTLSPDRRHAVGMFYDKNVSFEAHIDISHVDLSVADTNRNLLDSNEAFVAMALKDGKPVGYVRPGSARMRLSYIGRASNGRVMSDCILTGTLNYWNGKDTIPTPFYLTMDFVPFEDGQGVTQTHQVENRIQRLEPQVDSAVIYVK